MVKYYVSMLVMKNYEIEGEPIFVIAYFIHSDRKSQSHFRFFFDFVTELFKFNEFTGMITDKELGITTAIDKCFELKKLINLLLFCNNHLLQDINRWCDKKICEVEKKIRIVVKEIKVGEEDHQHSSNFKKAIYEEEDNLEFVLTDDLNQLKLTIDKIKIFKSDCKTICRLVEFEDIQETYQQLNDTWIGICKIYFSKYIFPHIQNNFKKLDMINLKVKYESYDLKNNISESMNCSVKKFNSFKIYTLDMVVLSLFNFSSEQIDEFNRAYKGLGNYRVKDDFKKVKELRNFNFFDYPSLIKEFKNEYSLVKQSTVQHKQLSQVKIAELIISKNLVEYSSKFNCYYVKAPFDLQPFSVSESTKGTFVCNCTIGRYACSHIKAVQLFSNSSTGSSIDPSQMNISNQVNKRNKDAVKPGQKGALNPKEMSSSGHFENDYTTNQCEPIQIRSPKRTGKTERDRVLEWNKEQGYTSNSDDLISQSTENSTTELITINEDLDEEISLVLLDGDKLKKEQLEKLSKLALQLSANSFDNWYSEEIFSVWFDHLTKSVQTDVIDRSYLFYPPSFFWYKTPQILQTVKFKEAPFDTIIFPFNTSKGSGSHWILSSIFLKSKSIIILDSLTQTESDYKIYFKKLFIVAAIYLKVRNKDCNIGEWRFYVPKDTPKQRNGHDCGPRVCHFMSYIITNSKWRFNQKFKESISNAIVGRNELDYSNESFYKKHQKPEYNQSLEEFFTVEFENKINITIENLPFLEVSSL